MTKAASWHREHPHGEAGAKFKSAMDLRSTTTDDQAEQHRVALELNECLEFCKEHWLVGRKFSRLRLEVVEEEALAARHAQFVKYFAPLDCLDECAEDNMLVFKPLPSSKNRSGTSERTDATSRTAFFARRKMLW